MTDESETESTPSSADRVLMVFFTAPFLSLLSLAVLVWAGFDYFRQLDQASWLAVPATITKVDKHRDQKQDYLDVTYTYTYDAQDFAGEHNYVVHEFDFDDMRIPELEAAHQAALNIPSAAICFVDPDQPDRSVLERFTFTRWHAAKIVFAFILLYYWLAMLREAWRRQSLTHASDAKDAPFVPIEPQVLYPIAHPALNAPSSDSRTSMLALLPMLLVGDYNTDLPRWWIALVMACVLILALAILIIPRWVARRRNPASTLELDAAPVAAGDYIQGTLKLDVPVPAGTSFRLTLQAQFGDEKTPPPVGILENLVPMRRPDVLLCASALDAEGTSFPFRIPLPKIFIGDGITAAPTHWYLIVRAALPDRNYQAMFDIPQQGEVEADPARDFYTDPQRTEALAHYRTEMLLRARIFLEHSEDVLDIRIPAPRIPLRAMLATCLGVIVLAPFILRIQFGTGTMLGFAMILWSLCPWFSSTQLRVMHDSIAIRRGLLRLLRLRRPRIVPIDLKTEWSMPDDHIATHLVVRPLGKRKRAVARWLPNQYIAILLQECICEFIVAKNSTEAMPMDDRLAS